MSHLESVLNAGHFAVTLEISPPVGPNRGAIQRQIDLLADYADAFNVTDNQSARVHTSSLATSVMVKQAGLDPVLQMTCRDRNRLAMQSDLLGASLFGVENVLALSGDAAVWGDHPHAKGVFEIDSMNLIRMIRMMRDDGVFENGKPIPKITPSFFIGAAANPFAPPHDFRPIRLAKKIAAGADFIQTQLIFNVPRFREYMKRVVDLGLHERTAILAGIGPVRSVRAAEYMRDEIAGMDVPDDIIKRLKGLDKEKAAEEGVNLCIEIGEEVKDIEGVRGVHIMAVSWHSVLPDLVTRLGLHPRPDVPVPSTDSASPSP
jgi:methylenetetrahydrofolate reductase (NADPH)